jgi:hypothetical protein
VEILCGDGKSQDAKEAALSLQKWIVKAAFFSLFRLPKGEGL